MDITNLWTPRGIKTLQKKGKTEVSYTSYVFSFLQHSDTKWLFPEIECLKNL